MAQADTTKSGRRNGHEPAARVELLETSSPRSPSLLDRAWRELSGLVQRRIPRADLDERDPDYIREQLPLFWLFSSIWFRGEVRGLGNIPDEGPVLLVGNHSGGNMIPDTMVFTVAFSTYFGVERRLLPACAQPRAVAAGPELAAQVRHGRRLPGQRQQGARPPVPRCSSTRAATTRSIARAGNEPRRLRRAQGLHPPRARARRADRPGRRDRRAGDRAVPHPRRAAGPSARARSHASPQGAADLARRSPGSSTSATSATSRCRPRSRSRRCPRLTCAPSSARIPTSTRSTTT